MLIQWWNNLCLYFSCYISCIIVFCIILFIIHSNVWIMSVSSFKFGRVSWLSLEVMLLLELHVSINLFISKVTKMFISLCERRLVLSVTARLASELICSQKLETKNTPLDPLDPIATICRYPYLVMSRSSFSVEQNDGPIETWTSLNNNLCCLIPALKIMFFPLSWCANNL